MKSRATEYALAVRSGDLPACQWVKLACERHLSDLDRSDVYYDDDEEENRCGFIEQILTLEDGSPFMLEPWQSFLVGSLFAWKRENGLRKYNNALIFVPRKNGKSALLAAIVLSSLVQDGQAYSQQFALASDRGQASLLRDYVNGFIKRSPDLSQIIDVQTWLTRNKLTDTVFKALHADWRRLDGLNPSTVVFDEYHAQEGPELDDVINSAFGSQPNYLYAKISTAGEWSPNKPAIKARDLGEKVLQGLVDLDEMFYVSYTIDEGDKWDDPKTWAKANPNLGVSKNRDYMEALVKTARELPQKALDFMSKQLNCWIESYDQWIDKDLWAKNAGEVDWASLYGRTAYVGIDLARVCDLSSLVAVIPPENDEDRFQVVARHFIPADDIEKRSTHDKVPYIEWRNAGNIVTTEGNTTDFSAILETIREWENHLNIEEIAYDRHFAGELVQSLYQDGHELVPFGQGFISMNDAVCGIERLLISGKLNHGDDPVLAWAASNAILATDPAGNRKMDKKRSKERIDPMVALGMAIARAEANVDSDGPEVFI